METFVPNHSNISVNVYAIMALSGQFYDENHSLTAEVTNARLFTKLSRARTFATKLVKQYKQSVPFIVTFTGSITNVQHDSFRPKPKKR